MMGPQHVQVQIFDDVLFPPLVLQAFMSCASCYGACLIRKYEQYNII